MDRLFGRSFTCRRASSYSAIFDHKNYFIDYHQLSPIITNYPHLLPLSKKHPIPRCFSLLSTRPVLFAIYYLFAVSAHARQKFKISLVLFNHRKINEIKAMVRSNEPFSLISSAGDFVVSD